MAANTLHDLLDCSITVYQSFVAILKKRCPIMLNAFSDLLLYAQNYAGIYNRLVPTFYVHMPIITDQYTRIQLKVANISDSQFVSLLLSLHIIHFTDHLENFYSRKPVTKIAV